MAKTILCIDDSVTMQKVAEITFEASDYSFRGARNADDGLADAKAVKPDLILADAVMPGKTGYDLCQSIKAEPSLAGVPVLIMCGNSQAYDPARGDGAGADGHVVKPWDTAVMLERVAEVLGAGAKPAVAAAPKPVTAASSAPLATPPASPFASPPKLALPATPPPLPRPAMPNIKNLEPPRSATIMGMPSIKLPGNAGPDFGKAIPVTPVAPRPPAPVAKSLTPTPPPPAPPPLKPLSMPDPIRAVPDIKPPRPVVAPKPFAVPPAAASKPLATIPEMPRPPMIKGIPQRRPPSLSGLHVGAAAAPRREPLTARAPIAARTAEVASEVATAAGLDPNGPEMAAITALSREVVERVVWEVVPELAETIIREHLAKNGLPRA